MEALKIVLYRVSLDLRYIENKFQSEKYLFTTVSIVLNSNSGTFSLVFVNILL